MGRARRGKRLVNEGVTQQSETGLGRTYLPWMASVRNSHLPTRCIRCLNCVRLQHSDTEICAYHEGVEGRYRALRSTPVAGHAPIPQRSLAPTGPTGFRTGRKGSPEETPSFQNHTSLIRCRKTVLFKAVRCDYDLLYAPTRECGRWSTCGWTWTDDPRRVNNSCPRGFLDSFPWALGTGS
jgi:hypothetical protein